MLVMGTRIRDLCVPHLARRSSVTPILMASDPQVEEDGQGRHKEGFNATRF